MVKEGGGKERQKVATVNCLLAGGSLVPLLRAPLQAYFSSAKVFLPCKVEALFSPGGEGYMVRRGEGPSAPSLFSFLPPGKMLQFKFGFCWRAGQGRTYLVYKVILVSSSFTLLTLASKELLAEKPPEIARSTSLVLLLRLFFLFNFFFSLFSNHNKKKVISIPL